MPFFKSNKNKTASAATTPAQTPRSSMQEQRTKSHKMTQEEALEKLMRVTMGDAANGPYILMSLFKSFKNSTSSAAASPRSSMQESRPAASVKMTQEQALKKLMHVTMGDAASGPYIR
ncbi:hypothetical protein BG006_010835 [Podila minutissima]|uniref:Uncharacterized protein n=1 Tax=Podila minutissima TaxID=64525 RepID=A0A9P5SCN3_9FUNG|nr:hypothetical protein BG006_010835 [Podila minutissima]